ncbi:unnamed protein product [Vicia faba]|uniref:PH domain-containing protein n=1 Tax=Vicia faba TaxID=3906 RepID=A0AAV1A2H8_VICFA|nr:unnamed protein product [Vicia faba]
MYRNRNSSPLRFSSGTTIHYWSYHVLQTDVHTIFTSSFERSEEEVNTWRENIREKLCYFEEELVKGKVVLEHIIFLFCILISFWCLDFEEKILTINSTLKQQLAQ